MSFYFSKSKFVSACVHCDKYAWLDKYMPEQKTPVDDFTQSIFDNGHKVGELAKEYFSAVVDVTSMTEDGKMDLEQMLLKTREHIRLATPVIAEASFSYGGFFCSADILTRNSDGSYNLYEVKSSKQEEPTRKNPTGVKEKYILDAAYQRYVLKNCGIRLGKVFVVLLRRDYIRGDTLDLNRYFILCDVTAETAAKQTFVADKLNALEPVLSSNREPVSVICGNCSRCDYFRYCSRDIASPSPFDVYDLKFPKKCKLYQEGVSFYHIPKAVPKLSVVAKHQIVYHGRPGDAYVDKAAIRNFLDSLTYPLYSLDFETYQAVVPEHSGMATYEQIPFQYSLHIMQDRNTLKQAGVLDLSDGDPRRGIAERLVQDIPCGACVIAYHHSTEKNIIERLAGLFPDLAPHLLSFTYRDPLEIFQNGYYYVPAMGNSLSLKSVAPALYPDDPEMDYHNLTGDVKNGTQAMNAILRIKDMTPAESEKLRQDLENYCALDTLTVVKILQKFYEVTE